MIKPLSFCCIFLFGLHFFSNAQNVKKAPHIYNLTKQSKCKPYQTIEVLDSLISEETITIYPVDSLTQKRFSPKSIQVAKSIEIIDLLNEFCKLEARSNIDTIKSDLKILFVRQELDERLTLSGMDIETVIAELDCEQERLIEIRNYLKEYNYKKTKTSTLLAIITGSIETIGSGFIAYYFPNARKASFGLTVGGGFLSSYFSLKPLFHKSKITIHHHRNHLNELKINPKESKLFPQHLWYFLTNPSGIDADTISHRNQLLESFKGKDFLEQTIKLNGVKVPAENIIFAESGCYDENLLSVRINMIELLKINISSMNYDLKLLQQELVLKTNY